MLLNIQYTYYLYIIYIILIDPKKNSKTNKWNKYSICNYYRVFILLLASEYYNF